MEVHDRPRILALSFGLDYPEYLAKEPETRENIAGDLVIPVGTEVLVRARADMPLQSGWIRWEKEDPLELELVEDDEAVAEYQLDPEESGKFDLAVVDRDWSLESRPPARGSVNGHPHPTGAAPPRR